MEDEKWNKTGGGGEKRKRWKSSRGEVNSNNVYFMLAALIYLERSEVDGLPRCFICQVASFLLVYEM